MHDDKECRILRICGFQHIFFRDITVQYLHSHGQKSIENCLRQWDFACQPMFSYGQCSKCADLLNNYSETQNEKLWETLLLIRWEYVKM